MDFGRGLGGGGKGGVRSLKESTIDIKEFISNRTLNSSRHSHVTAVAEGLGYLHIPETPNDFNAQTVMGTGHDLECIDRIGRSSKSDSELLTLSFFLHGRAYYI